MAFRTVLFDLDGVIRHFDPEDCARAAREHGVDPGDLVVAAFSHDYFGLVITGQISRAEWVTLVGEAVGSPEAASEWLRTRGAIDPEAIDLISQLRAAGYELALLTNGTDTVEEELDEFGIAGHFDRIFNTARLGIAKPDPRCFDLVLGSLGRTSTEVFFTDDSFANITAATAMGFATHHFFGVAGLRQSLTDSGIDLV